MSSFLPWPWRLRSVLISSILAWEGRERGLRSVGVLPSGGGNDGGVVKFETEFSAGVVDRVWKGHELRLHWAIGHLS